MSQIKLSNRNRLFPWNNNQLKNFLSTDDFFLNDGLLEEDDFMPAMNIKELKNKFEVEFAAPGFTKDDFEVTLEDHMLLVSAKKETEKEENEKGYMRKEFQYNTFSRGIKLPETVDETKDVKAIYKDGILTLHLQKAPLLKETPKKVIEVL